MRELKTIVLYVPILTQRGVTIRYTRVHKSFLVKIHLLPLFVCSAFRILHVRAFEYIRFLTKSIVLTPMQSPRILSVKILVNLKACS